MIKYSIPFLFLKYNINIIIKSKINNFDSDLMLVQAELSKTLEELKTLQVIYESESSAWEMERSKLQVNILKNMIIYQILNSSDLQSR